MSDIIKFPTWFDKEDFQENKITAKKKNMYASMFILDDACVKNEGWKGYDKYEALMDAWDSYGIRSVVRNDLSGVSLVADIAGEFSKKYITNRQFAVRNINDWYERATRDDQLEFLATGISCDKSLDEFKKNLNRKSPGFGEKIIEEVSNGIHVEKLEEFGAMEHAKDASRYAHQRQKERAQAEL